MSHRESRERATFAQRPIFGSSILQGYGLRSLGCRLEDHDLSRGCQMRHRYIQTIKLARVQTGLGHDGRIDRCLSMIVVVCLDLIGFDVAHTGRYVDSLPLLVDGDSIWIAPDGQRCDRASGGGIQHDDGSVHCSIATCDVEPAVRGVERDGQITMSVSRYFPGGDGASLA